MTESEQELERGAIYLLDMVFRELDEPGGVLCWQGGACSERDREKEGKEQHGEVEERKGDQCGWSL